MPSPHLYRLRPTVFSTRIDKLIHNIFLIADRAEGGLGQSNQVAGQVSGVCGSVSFLAASVVGGLVLAKVGLSRKTLMLFVGGLVIPTIAFLYLASSQPEEVLQTTVVFCLAMFANGFGAVAHMYYMMKQIAPGDFQTAHYAFATGTMGLCNFRRVSSAASSRTRSASRLLPILDLASSKASTGPMCKSGR